jgi:hypothetical protein
MQRNAFKRIIRAGQRLRSSQGDGAALAMIRGVRARQEISPELFIAAEVISAFSAQFIRLICAARHRSAPCQHILHSLPGVGESLRWIVSESVRVRILVLLDEAAHRIEAAALCGRRDMVGVGRERRGDEPLIGLRIVDMVNGILLAGDRAPDAPIRGAAGQETRLFNLFKGPHWTLLGYDVKSHLVPFRVGLHIHTFGSHGDIIDDGSHIPDAYSLQRGDWVLVRPDGYVGAIVTSKQIAALETYLENVGLGIECSPHA